MPQQTCTPSTGEGRARLRKGREEAQGSGRRTRRGRSGVNYRLPVLVLLLRLAAAKPFDPDQQVNAGVRRSDQGASGERRGGGIEVSTTVTFEPTQICSCQNQNERKKEKITSSQVAATVNCRWNVGDSASSITGKTTAQSLVHFLLFLVIKGQQTVITHQTVQLKGKKAWKPS